MKKLLIALLAGALLFIFTSCGNESLEQDIEDVTSNVVFITGEVSNSIGFDVSNLSDFVEQSVYSAGSLMVIVPDGEPFVFEKISIPEVSTSYSSSKQEQLYARYVSDCTTIISQAKAQVSEIDLLSAITLGARELLSHDGELTLVISHSGISTTGVLNFSDGLLQTTDVDYIVQQLIDSNELPDLTGIDVVFYGLGDVCTPQATLSGNDLQTLKALWSAIFEASGALSYEFAYDVSSTTVSDDLPLVSTVEVSKTTVTSPFVVSEDDDEDDGEDQDILVFDEESFSFVSNTAELLTSENEVLEVLDSIILWLNDNSNNCIVLCGSTACVGTQANCEKLSLLRAQTIANLLFSRGIDESQIQCVGLGYEHMFYTDDLEGGVLIETIAATNRSVIAIDATSETAKEILSQDYAM